MPANPPSVNVNIEGIVNGDVNVGTKRSVFSGGGGHFAAEVRGLPEGDKVPRVTPGAGMPPSSIGRSTASKICGVPQQAFDLCGNIIKINGYEITTSYDNGSEFPFLPYPTQAQF